ncbi:MAG: DUF302 domain-containing protein [Anaerolineales bacterium]|nr:DUF302 domain-containing protein [Anaerolineales bacterium]
MNVHPYGMQVTLNYPFEQTITAVTEVLKEQGFGILTEINVQETLKKKLAVEFRRYLILGACNPPLAYQALRNELEIGLLMPCNVIVYEAEDAGHTVVSIADPLAMMGIAAAPALFTMAEQAQTKLKLALTQLEQLAEPPAV